MSETKTSEIENHFKTLSEVKCEVKKKGGLNYISWAEAWSKLKEKYPQANYLIREFVVDEYGNKVPYISNASGGYVCVSLSINTMLPPHEIWMPILNFNKQPIAPDKISAFDVNKSIQRALTKAIAMFGLGLYVYQGEDFEEKEKHEAQDSKIDKLVCKAKGCGKEITAAVAKYSVEKYGAKLCMDCQKKYKDMMQQQEYEMDEEVIDETISDNKK